ncbi:hypothetical protein PRK78_006686 [Emydomyces testavorans]|uniref:Uncharacterized protein n=1 Tax=Emydomyces testavorans TaxID=2070801 RepID=A0AAF0ILY2_9EURO|nr:hypothetical protein PRK78_006686 [Emydomyces testavorans]
MATTPVSATPPDVTTSLPPSSALFHVKPSTSLGFLWSSIGLAVLTALAQGMVTALAYMTESSAMWTFRFRLAKVEHWWWTLVSGMLLISLVLITLSFAAGNNNEAVSILALSTTTFLTIVRYMLPSWRSRRFIHNRWLAWAGPSRTAVPRKLLYYCGDREDWRKLSRNVVISKGKVVQSDYYGWHIFPQRGIRLDPTDILNVVSSTNIDKQFLSGKVHYVYNDGDDKSENVSLFWGAVQDFQPRVSRSISAIPANLLQSHPLTQEGFVGEGFCLAMGIVGRNKGLRPWDLVFNMDKSISTSLETRSTWRPRPGKTLRSYYETTLETVYGGLGQSFVRAVVELSLILLDADEHAVAAWLKAGCDHQSILINKALTERKATPEELKAHYESSYVSMIISLNNMKDKQVGHYNHETSEAKRPDIICLGLLLKARGHPQPLWWNEPLFASYRADEKKHLDSDWYQDAAKLLGLAVYPPGFEDGEWFGRTTSPEPKLSVPASPEMKMVTPSQLEAGLANGCVANESTSHNGVLSHIEPRPSVHAATYSSDATLNGSDVSSPPKSE